MNMEDNRNEAENKSAAQLAREKRLKKFEEESNKSGDAMEVDEVQQAGSTVSPAAQAVSTPSPSKKTETPAKKLVLATQASPPPLSPSSLTPTKEKGLVNSTLQRVLLITFKQTEALGDVMLLNTSEPGTDLSEEHVDRYIYDLLAGGTLQQHPFIYLMNAHGRCDKESRSTRYDVVKRVCLVALEQLSRHAALLLTVPDFVPGADNSTALFADSLLNAGAHYADRIFFLQQVLVAVSDQGSEMLETVVSALIDQVLSLFKTSPFVSFKATSAMKVLNSIVSHKPAVVGLTGREDFLLPLHAPSQTDIMQSFFLRQAAPTGRTGPSLEANTPLGLLLRPQLNMADPSMSQHFANPNRLTIQDKNASMAALRAPLTELHSIQAVSVTNILKGGAESKNRTVAWLCEALAVNAGAQASNPDPHKVSSPGMLGNLAMLLLNLCMPFVGDLKKEAKIASDVGFFQQSSGAFPDDLPSLQPDAVVATMQADDKTSDVNFISQCFFLTWRALNLSIVPQLDVFEHRVRHYSYQRHNIMSSGGDPTGDPRLIQLHRSLLFSEATLFQPELVDASLKFVGTASRWLLARLQDEQRGLPPIPSHFLDDILLIVIGFSKYAPDELLSGNTPGNGTPSTLTSLFDCVVAFLAKPELVQNPHILARLGQLLHAVYLDPLVKNDSQTKEAPHHQLLKTHPRSANDLAPALLALYGSVEHISEEEKWSCRVQCAGVLKFLWDASPAHRSTFQRIAADHDTFIRFANGLMNETNKSVATIMEMLLEVRSVQVRMADLVQWRAIPEAEREELIQRHTRNEQHLRQVLPLCNETIHMVCYLTSDAEIRTPFLLPALLDRLASMLLSVLVQLVGSKGLEIKVDNPESYEFKPKQMLQEICETMVHFSSSTAFQEAVSKSGFYEQHPTVLPKAVSTARKHRILPPQALDSLDQLCKAAAEMRAKAGDEDDYSDAPEHFYDPLLCHIMVDPVRMPSNQVIDRSTIEQHLLNDPMDPFSRQPLNVSQLVPEVALKQEIEQWKAAKAQKKAAGSAQGEVV